MRIIINVDENGDVTTEVENRTAAGQTAPGVPGAPPVAGDPAQALDAGAAPTLSAEAADAAPEPAPDLAAGGALDAGAAPAETGFGTAPEDKHRVILDAGHAPLPRGRLIRETLAWLDKYLGPVN